MAVHNGAVKPVTAVILSIILTMMIAQASTRIDGDRELGVRIISGILLKAGLVVVFAANAMTILQGIDEIGTTIAQVAIDTDVGGDGETVKLGDKLEDDVTGADLTDKLALIVVILLPYIVAELAGVAALVLIFIRFLQIYLMTAFGSLPIAFIAYEETKQIGIGYLKSYGSLVLSGVFIILAVKFYQALMGSWAADNIDPGDKDLGDFMGENFGMFFVAPVVLIFVLFSATKLSKKVTGDA
ncbi:type IV secretion system protein [Brevibacterium aurantiacum]|uniref:type IV secretion system protein n=1 Tax=Brevibacterium aurantiacum TaxID=273384 RepID=UPI0015F08DCB|nr:type IV secretion system protein [Brevibacterium aurantiacum]